MPGILCQHPPVYMHEVMHMMIGKFYPYIKDILESSLYDQYIL